MPHTDPRHHTARFAKLPKDLAASFTPHRGKTPAVRGDVYVEIVHRTKEGLAVGPRRQARFVTDEEWATPAKTLGSISHWRLAPEIEGEMAARNELERFAQLREQESPAHQGIRAKPAK